VFGSTAVLTALMTALTLCVVELAAVLVVILAVWRVLDRLEAHQACRARVRASETPTDTLVPLDHLPIVG
jgi:hypothetical protein